jgi:hypothetical protein
MWFCSKIPMNPRRVNENVEQSRLLDHPSGLTKINGISLTAQTVPDIFISEDSA